MAQEARPVLMVTSILTLNTIDIGLQLTCHLSPSSRLHVTLLEAHSNPK